MFTLPLTVMCLPLAFAFQQIPIPNKTCQSPISLSSTRQPWDLFRFVSQSSKFVPTPFSTKAEKQVVKPNDILWTPNSNKFNFAPLDDVVMGGASSSSFQAGVWKGTVTDANNGGFIGIRNTPNFDWDMTACRGLELNLRQRAGPLNSSRFKIGLRDSTDFNGLVWTSSIDLRSSGGPTKIRVPLEKLQPTKFANRVSGVILDRSHIVGIQLVYSKFEYDGNLNPKFELGDIDVEIREIRAY